MSDEIITPQDWTKEEEQEWLEAIFVESTNEDEEADLDG